MIPAFLRRLSRPFLFALCGGLLAACATLDAGPAPVLDAEARWAVLPFVNATETPLAGTRAEAIAEALLQARGVAEVRRMPAAGSGETLFEPGERKAQEAALAWAREQGLRYALGGTVSEWRYKVGVDGEPAVGVSLQVIDVKSGKVLWSGVGGKSGWSRESLAALAQKLMRDLLAQAWK